MTGANAKIKRIYVGTNLVRPVWKPGSNTIAYYPLTSTSTVNDMSGNNRNLTNNGVTFGTYGGISCASFPNANAKRLYGSLPLTGNHTFTVNVYLWRVGNSIFDTTVSSQIFVLGNTGSSGGCFGTSINNSTASTPNVYINYTWGNDKRSSYTNTTGHRELITVVNDTSTIKMYRNGTLINDNSITFSVNSTNFTIGSFPTASNSNYQNFYGYMSEFIVESKARTNAEVSNYYNQTKSNYGL